MTKKLADKVKPIGPYICIAAVQPISFLIGWCAVSGHQFLCGATIGALAGNYVLFCRLANIQFGRQWLLRKQLLSHLGLATVVWLVSSIPVFFILHNPGYADTGLALKLTKLLLASLPAVLAVLAGARTYLIVGVAVCLAQGLVPTLALETETESVSVAHTVLTFNGLLSAAAYIPVGFAKYRTEECSLVFLVLAITTSLHTGASFGVNPLVFCWILLSVVFSYLQMLWLRRKRTLPTPFRGCKFVTLNYLRHIAATGEGIRRCQDLPSVAFGDPAKAKYLIVLSHRWMNRFTCDVRTEEHPEGLRLHMLVKHLDSLFSTAGICQGNGFRDKLRHFKYAMTGGSDVLVFLDFMSLPQVGRSEEGNVIPRTDDEEDIFERCLPSMSILYSMFPVLVSPEVDDTSSPYYDSGWCWSESSIAWLGGQLALFPSNDEIRHRLKDKIRHNDDLPDIGRKLERSLEEKTFLFETDRSISRTMIRCFVLKRRLLHALQNKLAGLLEPVLQELVTGGYEGILNQPVDDNLNTPLHYAVSRNFPEGVQLLLDAGADKATRNLHGDTSVQYCMLPRLNKAARLCRRLRSNSLAAAAASTEDGFIKFTGQYTFSAGFCENSTCDSNHSGLAPSPLDSAFSESIPSKTTVGDSSFRDGSDNISRHIVSLDDDDDDDGGDDEHMEPGSPNPADGPALSEQESRLEDKPSIIIESL
mmetsp:Transcript_88188/g.184261  ORF Transcript_88188/g.184261 Transcript_88188/m.184261 type:complete len:702 (-) Transcript_88188:87-2192(-)